MTDGYMIDLVFQFLQRALENIQHAYHMKVSIWILYSSGVILVFSTGTDEIPRLDGYNLCQSLHCHDIAATSVPAMCDTLIRLCHVERPQLDDIIS